MWWIVLTALYVLLLPFSDNLSVSPPGVVSYVTAFIGLFVPIGSNNFIFVLISYGAPILAPLVLGIALDLYWRKNNVSLSTRIALTLLVLLILTASVDVVFGGEWTSLNTFFSGTLHPGKFMGL